MNIASVSDQRLKDKSFGNSRIPFLIGSSRSHMVAYILTFKYVSVAYRVFVYAFLLKGFRQLSTEDIMTYDDKYGGNVSDVEIAESPLSRRDSEQLLM